MANGIEELFPEVFTEPAAAPEPAAATPEPSQPSPEVMELRGQVAQLGNMVGQLVQQRQAPPQQQGPPPGQVDLRQIFEDSQFFTPDDSRLLLASPEPDKYLNGMANKIKREVAAPLLNVIRAQGETLAAFNRRNAEELQRIERGRQEQAEQARFNEINPDLAKYDKLVRMEAQQLANEAQANPAQFAGLGPQQIHKLIGDRVRSTARSWGLSLEGAAPAQEEEQPQQKLSPATRKAGFMERGSGMRAAAPKPSGDPNMRELSAMSTRMQRARTR